MRTFSSANSFLDIFLVCSPELVGMQHEVSASNIEAVTNYRRIDDSDESDAEPDLMVRSENAEQVRTLSA